MKKILSMVKELERGKIFQLITPFYPAPIIEKLKAKAYNCYTINDKQNTFYSNFIEQKENVK